MYMYTYIFIYIFIYELIYVYINNFSTCMNHIHTYMDILYFLPTFVYWSCIIYIYVCIQISIYVYIHINASVIKAIGPVGMGSWVLFWRLVWYAKTSHHTTMHCNTHCSICSCFTCDIQRWVNCFTQLNNCSKHTSYRGSSFRGHRSLGHYWWNMWQEKTCQLAIGHLYCATKWLCDRANRYGFWK